MFDLKKTREALENNVELNMKMEVKLSQLQGTVSHLTERTKIKEAKLVGAQGTVKSLPEYMKRKEADLNTLCMITLLAKERPASLRMPTPVKVPPMYQGYDTELSVTKYQFEGLNWMGRKLEYRRHFYEELFQEVIIEPLAQEDFVRLITEEEIGLEDVKIDQEAKTLLGRLAYQRGNIEAVLHVFEGIYIGSVTSKIELCLTRRVDRHKRHSQNDVAPLMSVHTISLLFEAIYLKAKLLEVLRRYSKVAQSCRVILDTIEYASPDCLLRYFGTDSKLQETLNKYVEGLAGQIEEILPEDLDRDERYYYLALCYNGEGEDLVAFNLLKNMFSNSGNLNYGGCSDISGVANFLLGVSLLSHARISTVSDSVKIIRQSQVLEALEIAKRAVKETNPKVIFHLTQENAELRKLDVAFCYAKVFLMIKESSRVGGSNLKEIAQYSASRWHTRGLMCQAKGLHKEALEAFTNALDIENLDKISLNGWHSVMREGFGAASDSYFDTEGSNLICRVVVDMETSPVNEVSTSSRSAESKSAVFDMENEVGVVQFPDFLGKLLTYPPNFDVFRDFCKAKAFAGERCGNFVEHAGWQFRSCIVRFREEHFFLSVDLEKENLDRGLGESISLECYDGDVQGPTLKVKRKKSLLDTITQEGTELEAMLKELAISRKKRTKSRFEKVQKFQATRLMTSVGGSKRRGADREKKVVLSKAYGVDFVDVPKSTIPSKLAQAF
ncbi:hypothetical protein GIB67_011897 [Kingdonia uniflora]|uniref:Uncharacterized protein n=1 Tax=Kingdonia uniflora TaxID=39325 RepID=A0A7J7LZU9_9MAGN|nr:hypothetical protein GIB67_011897 [Kingdonia uniflora]